MTGKSGLRERRVNRPSCNYRCADGRYRRKRCGKLFKRRPRGVATRRRRAAARQAELDPSVYSDDWKANKKLSLNGFHHKRINHDKTLIDCRRRLTAYHDGFKRNGRLLITERSFSFNHRDADNTLNHLRSRLRAWS